MNQVERDVVKPHLRNRTRHAEGVHHDGRSPHAPTGHSGSRLVAGLGRAASRGAVCAFDAAIFCFLLHGAMSQTNY